MEKVCDGCKTRRSDLTDKELALFGAASNGHQKCMEVLLNAGADVNAIEHQYNTVLAVASAKGNPECVKLLLKAGADVNGSGEWLDYRALMAASGSGQAECMRLLINAGADVNHVNKCGLNALIIACESGQVDCVDALLKAGAQTQIPKSDCEMCSRYSGLYYAAEYGYPEILEMLLEAGADVNDRDSFETPVILAAFNSSLQGSSHIECLMSLIKAGADVNLKGRGFLYGETALIAGSYDELKVNMLLQAGADVNATGVEGSTALMHSASNGSHSCVQLLLEAGADVNAKDDGGHTALMYAATGDLILDMPPNVCLPPNQHEVFPGWDEYCQMECQLPSGTARIIDVYATEESALDVVAKGTDECLRLLLAAGADVNAKDNTGVTALITAATIPNVKCLDLLIKAGADVNVTDAKGVSALIKVASLHGLIFSLKERRHGELGLLDEKAMQVAADALVCVKLLLKAEAIVNLVSHSGGSVLAELETKYNLASEGLKPLLHKIGALLFAAGAGASNTTEKDGPVVLSLKETCRQETRKHLIDINPQSHLFGRVPLLELPRDLHSYLLYDQTLELEGKTGLKKEEKGENFCGKEDAGETKISCDNADDNDRIAEQIKDMEEKEIQEEVKERVAEQRNTMTPKDESKEERKTDENENTCYEKGSTEPGSDSSDNTDDAKQNSPPIRQRVHIRKFMFTDERSHDNSSLGFAVPQDVPVIDMAFLQNNFANFPHDFDGFNAAMGDFM